MGRSRSPARSSAASATARSLEAEAGRVERPSTSSGERRPSASPASTWPSSVTSSRASDARLDARPRTRRRGSPAPSRRRRRGTRASSATAISALPGPSAPIRLTCWPGRSEPSGSRTSRPGVTVTSEVGGERLLAARRDASADPAPRRRRRARRVDVPDERLAGRARANVRAAASPFTPAPTTAAVSRVGAAERLRGEHRRGARCGSPSPRRRRAPPAAARPRAEETSTTPITVGSPRAGLPGNEVTHFSSAWPDAERRHRAEVAGRIRRHVHLRRHRPLAAGEGDEGVAHRVHRPPGRHRVVDVPRRVERDHRPKFRLGVCSEPWGTC